MAKQNIPGGAPRFKPSLALAVFITMGSAQQPAALTQQTDALMVPLFALQIDKIRDFPVLRITFPGY
jgi:hypothetical protein